MAVVVQVRPIQNTQHPLLALSWHLVARMLDQRPAELGQTNSRNTVKSPRRLGSGKSFGQGRRRMDPGSQTLRGGELAHGQMMIPPLQPRLRPGKCRYHANQLTLNTCKRCVDTIACTCGAMRASERC